MAEQSSEAGALEQLAFQSAVLRHIGEAVIAIDPTERITYFGAGAEKLYGVPAAYAVGRPLAEVHHYRWKDPQDEQRAYAALERDGVWRGHNVHVLRSGEERHVESTVTVLRDASGAQTGLLAVIHDVTEHVEADARLRQQERQTRQRKEELETLLETTPAILFIARDREARDIIGNQKSRELLRLEPKQNLSLSAPPEERPRHFRAYRDGVELAPEDLPVQVAARTGTQVKNAELTLRFDDGAEVELLGNASPLFDADGRPRGAVGAFLDVTGRRRAQAELARLLDAERTARLQLERSTEVKERLLAVVSHDLRTPLQVVATCAELLFRGGAPTEAQVKRTGQIQRAVAQMRRILRDLGDYSLARSGRLLGLTPEPVDLEAVCEKAVADALMAADGKVEVRLVSHGPCAGTWDASRLTQLLGNLLGNALVHARGATRIEVRVHCSESHATVDVWNDGPPIRAEAVPSLFEAFKRTEGSRAHHPQGLGLGLFIVREIAHAHGGEVQVRSSAGEGTTFSVRLPRMPPQGA